MSLYALLSLNGQLPSRHSSELPLCAGLWESAVLKAENAFPQNHVSSPIVFIPSFSS